MLHHIPFHAIYCYKLLLDKEIEQQQRIYRLAGNLASEAAVKTRKRVMKRLDKLGEDLPSKFYFHQIDEHEG